MEIEAGAGQSPSLDEEEVRRFERLASGWWDERGRFRALHAINPARLAFIVEEVNRWRPGQAGAFRPLEGLEVADIGCGGGILSEPMTRLGARVTGIDPVAESIGIARAHARGAGLSIAYLNATAEDLAREGRTFDAIVASEVVEHVADLDSFLGTCRALVKPGGLLILSTLNRTAKAYGLAILAAERLLGLVPPGTHDWKKFKKPEELEAALGQTGFRRVSFGGIVLNPLMGTWGLSETDLAVNYMASAEAV
jgi:2-polyprenyl-6-hydroxyphenyl methylase / 3-demethylubiquinone-9 3-methyltransferase